MSRVKISPDVLKLVNSKNNTIKFASPILHSQSGSNQLSLKIYDNEIIEKIKNKLILNDVNRNEFWTCVERLNFVWGDGGDNMNNNYQIQKNLREMDKTRYTVVYLTEFMYLLMDELHEKLKKSNIKQYNDMEPIEQKKLLSHVIGKGRNFYNLVCETNNLVCYLISQKSYKDFRSAFGSDNTGYGY